MTLGIVGSTEPVEPSPPEEPVRRRRRWWLWSLPVVLVALLIGGLVIWTHQASTYRADLHVSAVGAPDCTGTQCVGDPSMGACST